jgi:Fe-S-cluster containining protein
VPDATVPAGPLGAWLDDIQAAIAGRSDASVACGDCVACCTASQFVHIGPEELDAKSHIPPELLFPAPGMPKGTVLMGYDDDGRCPMLGDRGCTIYEHRPRTCRTYDCRVFAATEVYPDEPEKAAISARALRWRFTHLGADQALRDSLIAAARQLRDGHPNATATEVAVRVVSTVERR